MKLSTLVGLIFCNILWSAAYSVSKTLMQLGYRPLEVSFLRNFFGCIPLLIYCSLKKAKGSNHSLLRNWISDLGAVDLRIFFVGLLTFFVSPVFQMTGLNMSRAIDGTLMIAMEPLFTIVPASLFLGERMRLYQVVAIFVAVIGAGVLTEVDFTSSSSLSDARLIGNLIIVISLWSEAAYSIIAKPALERRSPVLFMTIALATGVALLFTYLIVTDGPQRLAGLAPLFQRMHWIDFAGIFYLGFGCTAFAYLFWMLVLKDTPVSIMALTLYIQPVLGIVWGNLLLGEKITIATHIGAALILGAVWLGSRPIKS